MAKNKLNTGDYKILITISLLNKIKDFPSVVGLKKILNGTRDNETNNYQFLPTFSTLISINNRRLTAKVKTYVNLGLVKNIYDSENDNFYLAITNQGQQVIDNYTIKHGMAFEQKTSRNKKSFIHLDNFSE